MSKYEGTFIPELWGSSYLEMHPPQSNPLYQHAPFAPGAQKKEKPKLQKNCDLCGDPLGEVYWVGLTHPNNKLGAITCDKRKCYSWLHKDHRKKYTRILDDATGKPIKG